MSEQKLVIMSVLEGLGELNACLKNLMKATNIDDPKEVIRSINNNEWKLTKVAKAVALVLSAIIDTVSINTTTEKFVAVNVFVKNTEDADKVKISDFGDNFTGWFLKGKGKIEKSKGSTVLQYQDLKKSSLDKPIITELGGEAKAETTLTEMFHLMSLQKNGKEGALLTNGYANIFYTRDINRVLRAVRVRWDVYGWDVDAYSVDDPNGWPDGDRVVSRNSVTV